VDAQGLHAMMCKKAPGRIARHQVLNDITWRSLGSASIPATKEPSGLVNQDGKRPGGLTLIPWRGGKSLAWDVTVVSTLAQSYVDTATTGVGMVAELAAERKLMKYSNLKLILSSSLLLWKTWERLAHRPQTLSRPLVIKPSVCLAKKEMPGCMVAESRKIESEAIAMITDICRLV